MAWISLAAAVALALVSVGSLALVVWIYVRTPRLADLPVRAPGNGPTVSIVVAARDEERNVREAVMSMLAQEYPHIELIVVDDRSVDRTGAILDELARGTPRLKVVHVRELPAGWLGKNHAQHTGAQKSTGELLLFIDGDIILHPTAISRAVRYLESEPADNVTVSPQMVLPTWPLQMVTLYFLNWGVLFMRAWDIDNATSSASIGIGAFNMMGREAYSRAGGHARIPMRPDDDLMLGKLLKQSGARQRLVFGQDMVSVEWYRSVREATLGFRKNAFAALNYSLTVFVASLFGAFIQGVWPFVAVFITSGLTQTLYIVTVAALLAAYARTALAQRMPVWLTLLYPVACALQLVMVVIAVTRTLRAGGIDWRGTFYRLDELRANRV